jgi:hypothetical protein
VFDDCPVRGSHFFITPLPLSHFLAAFPLFLNHIANRWPILLDIQHRIAMVSRIDGNVID